MSATCPPKKLGVDVDHGFKPEYVTIAGKEKTLAELREAAKDSREIYLATDPDREGEAIAWHVAGQLKRRGPDSVPIRRALFHEITKDAVQRAIASAGDIDERKVNAQQARRVLDRLVGYKASPVLWKTVKKGLSAGRVQTVALRLLVEREREIRAFKPVEYWTSARSSRRTTRSSPPGCTRSTARSRRSRPTSDANRIVEAVRAAAAELRASMNGVVRRRRRCDRRIPGHGSEAPGAPQEPAGAVHDEHAAAGGGEEARLRLQADHAARAGSLRRHRARPRGRGRSDHLHAHGLHARVGGRGGAGARAHSRRCSAQSTWPTAPRLYGDNRKNAQDAHEAVRPTDPTRRPELVQPLSLSRSVQALSADLAAIHGVADGAGSLRHDDGRLRPIAATICSAPTGSVIKFRASWRSTAKDGKKTKGARSKTSRRCP